MVKTAAQIPLLIALALPVFAQNHTASDLGRTLREAGLDPTECYRVRDIEFSQEDAQFYLTSGYLIFGKPVNGAPVTVCCERDAYAESGIRVAGLAGPRPRRAPTSRPICRRSYCPRPTAPCRRTSAPRSARSLPTI